MRGSNHRRGEEPGLEHRPGGHGSDRAPGPAGGVRPRYDADTGMVSIVAVTVLSLVALVHAGPTSGSGAPRDGLFSLADGSRSTPATSGANPSPGIAATGIGECMGGTVPASGSDGSAGAAPAPRSPRAPR
jgi:hypothetical protein